MISWGSIAAGVAAIGATGVARDGAGVAATEVSPETAVNAVRLMVLAWGAVASDSAPLAGAGSATATGAAACPPAPPPRDTRSTTTAPSRITASPLTARVV